MWKRGVGASWAWVLCCVPCENVCASDGQASPNDVYERSFPPRLFDSGRSPRDNHLVSIGCIVFRVSVRHLLDPFETPLFYCSSLSSLCGHQIPPPRLQHNSNSRYMRSKVRNFEKLVVIKPVGKSKSLRYWQVG